MGGQGLDPSICPEGTKRAFIGYSLFATPLPSMGPPHNALGGSGGGIKWTGGTISRGEQGLWFRHDGFDRWGMSYTLGTRPSFSGGMPYALGALPEF